MDQENRAKRQKFVHQPEPISYPHIPESAQDREENHRPHLWQKDPAPLRLIESKFFQLFTWIAFAHSCSKKLNPQYGGTPGLQQPERRWN